MNNNIKEIKIDEIIWGIFILLSILNIIGDENKKIHNNKKAKNIFTFTIAISFIIYLYIFKKNYKLLKETKFYNINPNIYEIRVIGSFLITLGALFLLYFQLNDSNSNNSSIL